MNYYVLTVFAPLLILTGILGFIIPEKKSLTSTAPGYNVFHILFGAAGIMIVTHHENLIRVFNVGFGIIDLYQAAASHFNLFPQRHFKWKSADDVLHIVIGAVLVLVGVLAD